VPIRTGILPKRYAEPRLAGRGGMGEIYVARDLELGRTVAIKLLAERLAEDPEVRERFRREALTAARLSGEPHVVTIYDVGEQSGIRLRSVVPRISWLLFKAFWWRMGQKYVIRDFHPLVFFYSFGVLMLAAGFVLGLLELVLRIAGNAITPASIVLVAVLLIAGLQMTLFAMWFDMEANKDLR